MAKAGRRVAPILEILASVFLSVGAVDTTVATRRESEEIITLALRVKGVSTPEQSSRANSNGEAFLLSLLKRRSHFGADDLESGAG